jgi:tetratricopeptide (TPR) repeat protein
MKKKKRRPATTAEGPRPNDGTTRSSVAAERPGAAWWISLALAALILIVFAPVRDYGYLAFDDKSYVVENSRIAQGLTWNGIVWALTTSHAGFWMPLTWLSYMVEIHFFGLAGYPHHVTNVILHLLSTLALFWFLRRVTARLWESAFVAVLFAIHPLRVESVVWITERKDMLCGLFWMLSLCAYAAYVRRPGPLRYLAVAAAFGLALMSKPMAVTLPFVLLLLDIWPLQRMRPAAAQGMDWTRAVLEKLPLLGMAALSAILTISFHRGQNGLTTLTNLSLGTRLANALQSYAVYIGDMMWPANLALFYPFGDLSWWKPALSVALLGAVSAFVVCNAAKRRYLLVGWLWYLGTLLPVSGVLQAGLQARADRFTYLPLIGLFLMASWGAGEFFGRWRRRGRIALATAAVLIAGALAAVAGRQVRLWESRVGLWEHALRVTTNNYMAHAMLAYALADLGRVNDALRHYREALRIKPDFADARNNLGIALAGTGRFEEAAAEFRTAIRIGPVRADMHYNLGFALAELGRFDEAIAEYLSVLRLEPDSGKAHTKIGDAFQLQGRIEDAISRYNEALRVQPHYALAHNNLGVALSNQGRMEEAILHFNAALRIQPGLAEAHNGLGVALAGQGRFGEAVPHFSEALRIQPGMANARANLQLALDAQQQRVVAVP